MEQKFISLEEFKRNTMQWRDTAQSRLEALGDKATFADEMVASSAQSQVEYLESLDDEPIPFGQKDEAGIAPHLLAQLKEQKPNSNGSHKSASKVAATK